MKKFVFNNRNSNKSIYHKIYHNSYSKESFKRLSKRQIEFETPHPVREYKRFLSFRVSQTGINPEYKFVGFRKKDIIKPLERPSLYDKFNIKNEKYNHNNLYKTTKNKNTKWALGTAARAPDEDKLPKKQEFKNYYFPPKYNNKSPDRYKNTFLKTDFISLKTPKITKYNDKNSFLVMKRGYSARVENKKERQWEAKVGNINKNASSKDYNIINFEPLTSRDSNCKLLKKSLYNKRKGFGEIFDLTNVYNKNFNKEYTEKIEKYKQGFFKYNGVFTNMYDSSIRNGKITLPFELKQK